MARLVKCPLCEQYGHKEEMIYEEKRYYHDKPCHERYLKNKEATRIENEQWDVLYQYIIKLHDLVVLPKGNITRLKDLRAGVIMKDGKKVRQWRTGPDFALMLEAYKLAEDDIKWCIANKLDSSNDVRSINYCISIMINKLNDANVIRKNKLKQKEVERRVESQERLKVQDYKSKHNYTKKDDELDISDLL